MRPEGEWLVGAEELVTGALEGFEQMCKTPACGEGGTRRGQGKQQEGSCRDPGERREVGE